LCREHLRYCRNFVLRDINTLAACPWMPYHDPERPYVNRWFASTEGAQGPAFMRAIDEASQDRLEAEGGACIMYTHFGLGFFTGDRIQPRVVDLLTRLSRKKGWFVPVATLLDYMGERNPSGMISRSERNALERRWLAQQLRRGTGRA